MYCNRAIGNVNVLRNFTHSQSKVNHDRHPVPSDSPDVKLNQSQHTVPERVLLIGMDGAGAGKALLVPPHFCGACNCKLIAETTHAQTRSRPPCHSFCFILFLKLESKNPTRKLTADTRPRSNPAPAPRGLRRGSDWLGWTSSEY